MPLVVKTVGDHVKPTLAQPEHLTQYPTVKQLHRVKNPTSVRIQKLKNKTRINRASAFTDDSVKMFNKYG